MASARPSRRPWSRTAVVLSAGAVLVLAGCSATNPITTSEAYNVVDGVPVDLGGDVAGRNLLVFTSGEGEVGTMSGALTNQSREDVQVELSAEGTDPVTVDVGAGQTVLLGGDEGEEVELESVGAPPGANLTMTLSTPAGGSVDVPVPVFDGTLPEYAEMVPDAG
ncbi:hypothetical protein [Cellulomonas aerilata]|uniref:Lipoprotein n=1 Tax=Cellulomonas aerilata TaxID=515326 RepID=A0A512DF55_9CELL|nr:hypothetical protein [Cellulomonas aerilata]GEO34860.1 hypothetical protein CAE01nite_25850 [Cellulomonas aerilata]